MKPLMILLCLFLCSCNHIREWKLSRQKATWIRRVSEAEQIRGIWYFTAPGVKGSVYPPAAETPLAMDRPVPLMLYEILVVESLLQEQLPELIVEKYGDISLPHLHLSDYHRNYVGFLDRGGYLHVRVTGQAVREAMRRKVKPVPVFWTVWISIPFGKAFDLECE